MNDAMSEQSGYLLAAGMYGVSALICLAGIAVAAVRRMPALAGFLLALSLLLVRLALRNWALGGNGMGSVAVLLDAKYAAITSVLFLFSLLHVGLEYLEMGRRA